jgi:hypothetical protein
VTLHRTLPPNCPSNNGRGRRPQEGFRRNSRPGDSGGAIDGGSWDRSRRANRPAACPPRRSSTNRKAAGHPGHATKGGRCACRRSRDCLSASSGCSGIRGTPPSGEGKRR